MRRARFCWTALFLALILFTVETYADEVRVPFDIPASRASTGLMLFAEQSATPLVFLNDGVRDKQTNRVNGNYTILQALDILLKGTGINGTLNDSGVLTVSIKAVSPANDRGSEMKLKQSKNKKVSFFAGIAAFFASVVAIPNAVGQEPESKSGASLIEEVVVTAQKREQSLQDVSIAMTAFNGNDISEMGLLQPKDIANQTPGLDIKNAIGNVNPVFTIRGIGLNDYGTNNNPSVGSYVDEIYMASSAYLSFQMFDVERVEVLKGPQGTLYGRNTTGGAINFISRRPTEDFDAYVDVSYGRWNTLKVEAAVGGALGKNLNARVAFATNQSDGYLKNAGTIGTSAGFSPVPGVIPGVPSVPVDNDFLEQENYALRGSLTFTPSDTVDVFASFHYDRDLSDNLVYNLVGTDVAGFTKPDSDPFTIYSDVQPKIDHVGWGGVLHINWDTDFATVTSVTGYETVDRHMQEDDASPFRILETDYFDDLYMISQELRLSSNNEGSPLFWTAGFYYSHENVDFHKDINLVDFLLGLVSTEYTQKSDSWSLYGQAEWQFNEQWKLTGGLRYTNDDKSYLGGSRNNDPYGASFIGLIFPLPILSDRSFNEDDVSGKVALDWTPMDDVLLYLSFNKGFKSGGFDGSTLLTTAATEPFFGETLFAYEGGFKTTLLNQRLQWNASGFYYNFQDLQAARSVETAPGIFDSVRGNVGDADIVGVDTDLWWKPVAGLSIKVGMAWLQTQITKWTSDDPADTAAHLGNNIPDSPEFTINGMVRYEWPLSGNLTAAVMTDFNYNDTTNKDIDNAPELRVASYWLVNARASVATADGAWEVAVYGKNLSDEEYIENAFFNFTSFDQTFGRPRSYGVNVRYNWR